MQKDQALEMIRTLPILNDIACHLRFAGQILLATKPHNFLHCTCLFGHREAISDGVEFLFFLGTDHFAFLDSPLSPPQALGYTGTFSGKCKVLIFLRI